MSRRTKLIYLILVLGLIVEPHVITGHIFGLPEALAESIGTILLLLGGYVVYRFHQREIAIKEGEIRKLEMELGMSLEKLNESYKYIGMVNRKLPLISQLTSELLERARGSKKARATIFTDLLGTAGALAKADWSMLRMIDTETSRTCGEFVSSNKQYALLKTHVSNAELLALNGTPKKMHEGEELLICRSSDTESQTQCFLIMPKSSESVEENSTLLQNITDQAQLFYKYLY